MGNDIKNTKHKPASGLNYKIVTCVAFIFLILITGAAYCIKTNNSKYIKSEPEKIVETFLAFAAKQDYEKAKELSAGIVFFDISCTEADSTKGHLITNTDTSIIAIDKKWAVIRAMLETINPENDINVHWYTIHLAKKNTWKIYKIEEADPVFAPGNTSDRDIEEAKNVFMEFFGAILDKKYDNAGSYLIGRAKNSHERAGNILKDTVIVSSKPEINTVDLLTGNEKHLILKINYGLDEREVSTIVSYYKTGGGWKIYNVSQI